MVRESFKAKDRVLFDQVEEILFRNDPEGINFGFNKDEYAPEARTIIPRLREANSESDVRRIVLEGFNHWFSKETVNQQNPAFDTISKEIWAAWIQYSQAHT